MKLPEPATSYLSKNWKWFLIFSMIAGCLLRVLNADDMEYKEDEEFDFTQSQLADWSWVGMPSGVYVPNPGMSVWVFKALARLSGATQPTQLAHALQLFALLGICLLLPFALKILKPREDRTPWLWAMALALVNPFAVFYQRKLWPEPFLPVFSMLMLAGWWLRDRWMGAFIWGFVGAWLGQIHMSGFFYAAGFVLCTLIFSLAELPRTRVRWTGWLAGSILGALPLIPWLAQIIQHPTPESVGRGWVEAIQAKFWVFWVTNPLGLHLGNPLGLLRGQTTWAQISDFVRYPLIGGVPTYLNAVAHLVVLGTGAALLLPALFRRIKNRSRAELMPKSNLDLALISAIWGFGLLLTLSTVNIRRYYILVAFPLEFVWLARLALNSQQSLAGYTQAAKWLLGALWTGQLVISACFVHYIHVNEGSIQGDYGEAYHLIMRKRGK
ncbi:hypothetical protein WDW37_00600 [Bdellovibrionota bacterium FG-1]